MRSFTCLFLASKKGEEKSDIKYVIFYFHVDGSTVTNAENIEFEIGLRYLEDPSKRRARSAF